MAESIAVLRIIQLILGSIIGLLCIYFGYRLFSQIPVNLTNDGHFKMPKLGEVKLKVAPGIFFALLGTAIVYFTIDRSITIQAATPRNPSEGARSSFDFSNSPIPPFRYSCQEPGSTQPCPWPAAK